MDRYKLIPSVDMDSDPLLWWKSQERDIPTLSVLAKKYLCICGTSVSFECLFF